MERVTKKTQSYRENSYLINLKADSAGLVKCGKCGKKIKKELSYYYHPRCYCLKCWKPIDKQHKQEIKRVFGGI